MKIHQLHRWDVSPKEAFQLQDKLRERIVLKNPFKSIHDIQTVAGCDLSIDNQRRIFFCGVIVYTFPALEELERQVTEYPITFPYVPGLLAFREGPALLEVLSRLRQDPDILIFDGQGVAHPRRMGIASHLALFLDKPCIGCAKSRLYGKYEEPGLKKGSTSFLRGNQGEVIGRVLRTRDHVRPIFVSPGHRLDFDTSVEIVLHCLDKTRIPKPTREADLFVEAVKRSYYNEEKKDKRISGKRRVLC